MPGLLQAVTISRVHDCSSRVLAILDPKSCFGELPPLPVALTSFPLPFPKLSLALGDGGIKIDVPFRVEH